jgi:hypothetical protein
MEGAVFKLQANHRTLKSANYFVERNVETKTQGIQSMITRLLEE